MQTNEHSILESDYVKPHRPISNDELKSRYKKYMNKFKLSSEMVYHKNTRYFYHVKKYVITSFSQRIQLFVYIEMYIIIKL